MSMTPQTMTPEMLMTLARMGFGGAKAPMAGPLPNPGQPGAGAAPASAPAPAMVQPNQGNGMVAPNPGPTPGSAPLVRGGFSGSGIIGSVLNDVYQIKARAHSKKVNEAANSLYQYMRYKQQGNDAAAKQWLSDEKNAKLLEKSHDPKTVESQGLYIANKRLQQETMDALNMQLVRGQIASEHFRAVAEQAKAQAEEAARQASEAQRVYQETRTKQLGTVTPALKATLAAKKDVAETNAKANHERTMELAFANHERTAAMIQINNKKMELLKASIGKKPTAAEQTLVNSLKAINDEMKALNGRRDNLNKELKNVGWYNRGRQKQIFRDMQKVDQALDKAQQKQFDLNRRVGAMSQAGAIPAATANILLQTSEQGQSAVADEPIVVTPEDMKGGNDDDNE